MKVFGVSIYPLVTAFWVMVAIGVVVWRANAEPEFHKHQRVVVVGGFYRGTAGYCEALDHGPGWEFEYRVNLDSDDVVYVKESDLDPDLGIGTEQGAGSLKPGT